MRRHFKTENISCFVPKRDLCDICAGFEMINVSKDEYNKHTTRKQEARDEKTDVESLPADDSTQLITKPSFADTIIRSITQSHTKHFVTYGTKPEHICHQIL